jgi:hypothetical protein
MDVKNQNDQQATRAGEENDDPVSTRSDGALPAYFVDRVVHMMGKSQTFEREAHLGLRGQFRELVLTELLQPLVPHTCRLTHGTVIDANGPRRNPTKARNFEDDILVIDSECLPPFFELDGRGVYPVESVLARVEVKSGFNARSLREAIDGAAAFATLTPDLGDTSYGQWARPIQVLFAFRSDYVEGNDFGHFLRALAEHGNIHSPAVRYLCIPGRGFWVHGNRPFTREPRRWHQCLAAGTGYTEVLGFVALLLHELPRIRELRRRASLSRYVECLAGLAPAAIPEDLGQPDSSQHAKWDEPSWLDPPQPGRTTELVDELLAKLLLQR